jgi:hypothetical protein
MREALRLALLRIKTGMMERQHQAGYTRKPVKPDEFKIWESEQAWGDE